MTTQNTAGTYSARRPLIIGMLTLCILLGGFGTWAATTQISGAIVASGRIEVDQNRQVVQHPDGGVVAKIAVEEGQVVAEGALLLRLDSTQLTSELAILEGQLFELMARRGRLVAERDGTDTVTFDALLTARAAQDAGVRDLMDGQSRLFAARAASVTQEVAQLDKRKGQIVNQVQGIEAQQKALARQAELIEEELQNQTTLLERGLAQASRVLALQREQARMGGVMGELAAQKAQAEGRATEIEIEALKLQTTRREEAITSLRNQQFQELELSEKRRAILEQLDRMDIRAPVSGVVYGMTVFAIRSVIRPADPVMFLIPQDRPLVIAAQIDPIHVDQIFVDQDVALRFSALDQRQTPELTGRVTQLSADAFTDQGTQATYYRAIIVLSEGEQARLPEGTTLVPGMPVEAFIRTDDRTPLAYFIKPLADYFARALRES